MSRYAPAAVIRIASCLATVLMAALVCPAPVLAGAEPQVLVAGTELRLVDADGTVRAGDDLVGGELTLRDAYGEHRLRIEATRLDEHGPPPAIRLYAVKVLDPASGAWQELCRPGPDGLTLAMPLPGYFTDDGRYVADAQRFTITCTGGAIGKCLRFGYRPWAPATNGIPAEALYQTCVRMIRADYCGNGHGWTRNGMPVDLFDAAGILREEASPGLSFEAAWGPDGASCVAHVRVPENGSLDDVVRSCPRLAGKVGPAACPPRVPAAGDGVLIVNKS